MEFPFNETDTLEVKQEKFLIDLINFYGKDPNNLRGVLIQRSEETGETIQSCRYRTDDGKKCAIGRFISDEKYEYKIEKNYFSVIFSEGEKFLPKELLVLGENFCLDCQSFHDNENVWKNKENMVEKLKGFQTPFDLNLINILKAVENVQFTGN